MHLPQPYLGIGTWGMGGKYERDESTIDQSIQILQLGLSLGLRIIDTAELYGAGLCESIVGKAIESSKRDEVFLISKVWKTNLAYDDVLRAAEGSLRRLNSPYIDLYLVHWPSESVSLKETMRAMERLLQEGVIKAIGVSNFTLPLMQEAQQALTTATLAANQIDFSLEKQSARKDILPYCALHDIDVIAYRPLARGALGTSTHPALSKIAKKYDKTENQIALAWLLAQHTVPIPATFNPSHMRENAEAISVTLNEEDMALLCKD